MMNGKGRKPAHFSKGPWEGEGRQMLETHIDLDFLSLGYPEGEVCYIN